MDAVALGVYSAWSVSGVSTGRRQVRGETCAWSGGAETGTRTSGQGSRHVRAPTCFFFPGIVGGNRPDEIKKRVDGRHGRLPLQGRVGGKVAGACAAGKAVATCSPHTCAQTGVAGQRATAVTSDEDSCRASPRSGSASGPVVGPPRVDMDGDPLPSGDESVRWSRRQAWASRDGASGLAVRRSLIGPSQAALSTSGRSSSRTLPSRTARGHSSRRPKLRSRSLPEHPTSLTDRDGRLRLVLAGAKALDTSEDNS
ncbi:hypothetical protein HPB47_025536 [Ixodes persulcatus]|uniref:Uncharacterized protein n=1 Tax=Ixodes persulcatus TaxID=34615 RepID=A0AC60Q2F9_IXOPE|nr:hypothetical protein HPB47_025536 [Ixodes persulcatus]